MFFLIFYLIILTGFDTQIISAKDLLQQITSLICFNLNSPSLHFELSIYLLKTLHSFPQVPTTLCIELYNFPLSLMLTYELGNISKKRGRVCGIIISTSQMTDK